MEPGRRVGEACGKDEQDGAVRRPAEEDCRHHQHGHSRCPCLLSVNVRMFSLL